MQFFDHRPLVLSVLDFWLLGYRKIPKYSDTQKIAVIILKCE